MHTADPANQIRTCFRLDFPHSPEVHGFSLDLDLTLPGQGVTAIFGHSGSGKTTFLRCIAGLEKAKHGLLTIQGDTWQDDRVFVPTHKRSLGYVFQEAGLFTHLTVQDNLNFAIKRAAQSPAEELIEHIVDTMGIAHLFHRYPAQLSGGERQRTAIARALLVQPRLLLMDEPLASLDMARKQEILPYLERLRTSFDGPIFYISHSVNEVARLADHVVVLEEGRCIAQGSVTDVFSRIDFPLQLGNETGVVIQGNITERDEQWHLALVSFPGGELWLRDEGQAIGSAIRLQILARDISLTLTPHEDSSILNRLRGTITDIKDDMDASMVLVRLHVGNEYLIARLTRKSLHQLNIEVGKYVWAQIKSVAIAR
ncbi:molybdenum ABC transporter ATP-binding protein [Teredinibacter sp. KSP-S5-2]|uniref:molybdenum ABC transporter ATP-binding protein n=1 Tax=Teredinibacter sp. KSP-S5-2 TaxID=3034506 RepID=UPI002934C662|nr:molybdenum ABC transporter ATP-binding protein [Teredinibacter sp. KSP-S5-2]WNO11410.1 molybdenum ABC transporter ATP-binding protein [Teredinibacter sp. KSP-S5-2]